MHVVVVESPAKAKTINKYLGKDYTVLASYGHVRDLPPKDGSVRPDQGFSMDWEVDDRSEKHISDIVKALKGADTLLLATDPDREGEAISWHVQEVLTQRNALKDKTVRRITFNAITKSAVETALKAPRDLDRPLVEAYLARRALDYLVGFTLSPVLWRKLPGSRSAGRVQSVALRLICEREQEIEVFVSRDYWTVEAKLDTMRNEPFRAVLTHLNGTRLDKFALSDEKAAHDAVQAVRSVDLQVIAVDPKQARRHPSAPFTTSTLQQEASRKLSFSARQTMSVAQKLYEGVELGGETVGLITYMRTDGVSIAPEAIAAARALIGREYGASYVPETPRLYKTKAKNAQEAHEAIRPTDLNRHPSDVARYLSADQARLYELIWKRTLASQMESALLDQVAVDLGDKDKKVQLRANGSVVRFDGFLKVYREDMDDRPQDGESDENRLLPALAPDEPVSKSDVQSQHHATQPPPRYTEASLVKKLEELGIGRPSTYASIISVLQDRSYVRLDAKRFVPEDRGRLVTAFLENFFSRYVQYSFTADLENRLDEISDGALGWKTVLQDFWSDFKAAVDDTANLRISDVLDALDAELGPHLFPPNPDGSNPRECPVCHQGNLSLRIGKYGAFVGCSNYPQCAFTRPLVSRIGDGEEAATGLEEGPRPLGEDTDGQTITLRKGPYGFYVQKGEAQKAEKGKKAVKPPRVSIPAGMDVNAVDLGIALKLLALPREVGIHPETNALVTAGIGRFGPYLKHGDVYKSLPKGEDMLVLDIGLNRAVALLAEPGRGGQACTPAKSLGDHPQTGAPVTIHSGRYGPYVQNKSLRATLPRDEDPDTITLERAIELLDAKALKEAEKPAAKTRAAPRKKAAPKKTTTKTAPKTRAASRKTKPEDGE